ncbi:LLM class flavin-dependent oxidoreductase [Actinopolymorpha rutila]|uniref:Alkanesulfonate monooxygenase SsuD/methylene tetrahydromethanopterin reductase-like flavin-dependent oxidoreductase (Luciferase family) n=1 Tax=Actinopolymorpha rutila TaxID=446787 RepID=A0A852ZIE3_9ACTN|nr:LLM class flavin-dependent oxidoreductase [Actinopolymorpha rutila]NYH92023.1 alkanesulfonate monooxygenase SsuD/methylene tetrahydromethanopterin reductase-like flavin-dependent oxidoreductase (luciferase family) [Actinopolymorpha rutila]
MRHGIVILPEHRWSEAAPRWKRAEEYGFDHAWTYDHLAWRSLADGPWFGTVPTLTAAAMVTSRIKLGTYVATPNFRHPVSFLRDVLGLDDISAGRFLLGVGSGGTGFDATVLGHDTLSPPLLVARLGEFLDLLDRLLTEDDVSHAGDYFTAVHARTRPGSLHQPRLPILVAANGPKAMRLASRHGQGWITYGKGGQGDLPQWWRGVADLATRFDDILAQDGRDPATIDRYLSLDSDDHFALASTESFADATGRAAELGFTDVVVHWPRPDGIYAGDEAVLDKVASDYLSAP